jgi:hypothetical protein
MSERRRLAVATVAAVARRGNSGAELELGDRVIGRSACGRDRHGAGGQAEVFEDACGGAVTCRSSGSASAAWPARCSPTGSPRWPTR